MGAVVGARSYGKSVELCVRPDMPGFAVDTGASVSIDGVCLTLEKHGGGGELFFTAVSETLSRTTLAKPSVGRRVNLERAMRADGRLDGHFVLGHVDGRGKILSDEHVGISVVRTIKIPPELEIFMAEKGSVAIDGISLTIAKNAGNTILLSIIPATAAKTTMFIKKPGEFVNIECDVLARYIYNMIHRRGGHWPPASASPSQNKPENVESLLTKMERLGF